MLVGRRSVTTIGGLPIETGVVKLRLSELTDPVEFVETILKKYRVHHSRMKLVAILQPDFHLKPLPELQDQYLLH